MGHGLQPQEILLPIVGPAGLAVLAHLGRLVGPQALGVAPREHREAGAGHRRGHEDDGGQDQYRRRAADFVEDHRRHGHDEAGQRAEERQPRVEGGVPGLLP